MSAPEVNVETLDDAIDLLERRIGEAEARIRLLREENERLRCALGETSGIGVGAQVAARPVRQIVLEAERQEVRTRLRKLIEVL